MKSNSREFVYLNCLKYSGTVYHTQILDWLHLYSQHNVKFKLIQLFQLKEILKPNKIKAQLSGIRRSTTLLAGYIVLFPSRRLFSLLNAVIIFWKLRHVFLRNKEVLIFSRALIGPEIRYLRKITKCKLIFIFDARAATAEEKKYIALRQNEYTSKKADRIGSIYNLEYNTISEADKVFSVSNVLTRYFVSTMNCEYSKFFRYPCLSDSDKFFYDSSLRKSIRDCLEVHEETVVFIYSGGIIASWHMAEHMFKFFNEILKYNQNVVILMLTKDISVVESYLLKYPKLLSKTISKYVNNNEVFKYLNAADYGILFRENTIMNNVASPTKFAEYMLCGLPVIISEGVGDYSSYVIEKGVGFSLKESELANPELFRFEDLFNKKFHRESIATQGEQHFSKKSIIKEILKQFTA